MRLSGLKAIYIAVALATAYHTAYGAAYLAQGVQPTDPAGLIGWWIQGIAFAIAVDVSMIVLSGNMRANPSKHGIQIRRVRVPISWYSTTFVVVALLSAYFQLVYFWLHAQPVPASEGVSPYWRDTLTPLMDAWIIIIPLALPLIATMYAVAGVSASPSKKTAPVPSKPSGGTAPEIQVKKPETELLPSHVPETVSERTEEIWTMFEMHPEYLSMSLNDLVEVTGIPRSTLGRARKEYVQK
jgi:hypothetical protein